MFAFDEREDTALRGDLWIDLLPWLNEYESSKAAQLEKLVTDVLDWWISDSPRVTRSDTELDTLVDDLGRLMVRNHRRVPFGELAPHLKRSTPLGALHLPARAETLVRRLANRDFVDALLDADAETLLELKGTSTDTVQRIAAGIVGAAILVEPDAGVSDDEDGDDSAVTQLVDDLRVLSRWRTLRGVQDRPLLEAHVEDNSPEDVHEAVSRIEALNANDFRGVAGENPVDEIDNLVEQLDEREEIVLRRHLMADPPVSIGQLSSLLHVSKSRAGTIVAELKDKLTAACVFGTAAGGLIAGIRAEIDPAAPLDALLDRFPVLADQVPSLDVPLWLALDRIDDYFEVIDGWAVAPDLATSKAATIDTLREFESANGVIPLDRVVSALNFDSAHTESWMTRCAIPLAAGHALLMTATLGDHAIGAIEAVGHPVSVDDLIEVIGFAGARTKVVRALRSDGRVREGDGGLWNLTSADGSSSAPSEADRQMRQVKRLYRIDDAWCFRITVTPDHLRGSGLILPIAVANAFGCRQGTIREFASPLGTQVLRWTGKSPTCGTIRRFLADLDCHVGDEVFLTVSDTSGFDVRPVAKPAADESLRVAAALIGYPRPDVIPGAELPGVLATAVGLAPDAKPRRILREFQALDEPVAAVLEAAWVRTARG